MIGTHISRHVASRNYKAGVQKADKMANRKFGVTFAQIGSPKAVESSQKSWYP